MHYLSQVSSPYLAEFRTQTPGLFDCKDITFPLPALLLVLYQYFLCLTRLVPLILSSPHSNQMTISGNLLLITSICEISTCFKLKTKFCTEIKYKLTKITMVNANRWTKAPEMQTVDFFFTVTKKIMSEIIISFRIHYVASPGGLLSLGSVLHAQSKIFCLN